MSKKNYKLGIAILFLSASFMIIGFYVGSTLKSNNRISITSSEYDKVFNLQQAAKYLNMTEKEVLGIIQTEKISLESSGIFYGKMFPYFTIDNKPYFYKDQLDEWLIDASTNHREYHSISGR